jgi:hypothetical protein
MAGADGHHGLTEFAAEGFAEFWHILDYAVDAPASREAVS